MRCPDCGAALSEISIDSKHFLYRCNRCGGVLADSDTVNNITVRNLSGWRRIGVDPRWLVGGDDKCPVCSTRMQRYRSDEVPADLPTKRCNRCGKWWFPGDCLFRLKEAQDMKINYFRVWFGSGSVPGLLLPIAATAVFILAMGIGVWMVSVRQRAQISAGAGVNAFSATYLGNGRVVVTFSSSLKVDDVEYRLEGESDWVRAQVAGRGEVYVLNLEGLVSGKWYRIRILGKEYEFEAR